MNMLCLPTNFGKREKFAAVHRREKTQFGTVMARNVNDEPIQCHRVAVIPARCDATNPEYRDFASAPRASGNV